jgi:hypothetical protein
MHYTALVDEHGNLVIPGANLPAGTRLLLSADVDQLVEAARAGVELRLGPTAGIAGDDSWLKLAESSMDFWDNPIDDAIWNDA